MIKNLIIICILILLPINISIAQDNNFTGAFCPYKTHTGIWHETGIIDNHYFFLYDMEKDFTLQHSFDIMNKLTINKYSSDTIKSLQLIVAILNDIKGNQKYND